MMKTETVHDVPKLENPCPGCDDGEAEPEWCRGCQGAIIVAIAALPGQCGPLIPGPLNTGRDIDVGPRVNAVNAPSPSAGWDTADEVIRWAVRVEDQLRAHLGHADRTKEPWRSLGASTAYLGTYATALLSSPNAITVGFAALGLNRRLEQVTGTDRVVHRLPDPCLVCGHRGLERKDGGDNVRCRFCGATWDWDRFEFLAKACAYADSVAAS